MILRKIYNRYLSSERLFVNKIRILLGFTPTNLGLYQTAFRHKSVAQVVRQGYKNSNERLEFLGDAVLSSVVAEILFKKYPFKDEGFLTDMRSKVVNRVHLNNLAYKLGFEYFLIYDSKTLSLSAKQSAMLGDAFEALIGAVYLDVGYERTKKFLIERILTNHIDLSLLEQTENHKSKLLEWSQRNGKKLKFVLLDNAETDSRKLFTIQILIDGESFGMGKDFNKKNAEKLAAEQTCEMLAL
jgi:ribonuclease-3